MLTSAALVLLMTPGLALFYGGMARSKSVLNMLMMSFSALGVVSVLWVLYGYAIAFGATNGGLFGFTSGLLGLDDLAADAVTAGLPDLAFAGFQLMFAVITVALISGAVADRMKFGAWVAFHCAVGVARLLPGGACALAVTLKHRLGYDDALDVVGVHLVGGLVGTLMIGLVASEDVTGRAGLLLGGSGALVADQAAAAVAVMAYSFVLTIGIALLLELVLGLRVSEEDEVAGIDQSVHAESGYELAGIDQSVHAESGYERAGITASGSAFSSGATNPVAARPSSVEVSSRGS